MLSAVLPLFIGSFASFDVLKGRPWTWDTLGVVPLSVVEQTPRAKNALERLKLGETQDAVTMSFAGIKEGDLTCAWVYVMSNSLKGTLQSGLAKLASLDSDSQNLAHLYAAFKIKAMLKVRRTLNLDVEADRAQLTKHASKSLPVFIAVAFDGNPSLATTRSVFRDHRPGSANPGYLAALDCRNLVTGRIFLDDKGREAPTPSWSPKELTSDPKQVLSIADALVKKPDFSGIANFYKGRAYFEQKQVALARHWFKKAEADATTPQPMRLASQKFLATGKRSAFNRQFLE